MSPKNLLAFIGFVILAAGTYCPLLRPFGLIKWNLFALNKPFGLILLLIAVAGIITTVMGRFSVAKIVALIGLVLVVLLYVAALFKIHSTFSFIPFKGIAGFLARQVKFLWGWWVLFAGAALSVLATALSKKQPV